MYYPFIIYSFLIYVFPHDFSSEFLTRHGYGKIMSKGECYKYIIMDVMGIQYNGHSGHSTIITIIIFQLQLFIIYVVSFEQRSVILGKKGIQIN